MKLNNVHIIGFDGLQCIHIENGVIKTVTDAIPLSAGPGKPFTDVIAFPGLINSHDHLDFNLFPQLGNRIYQDYKEWGEDIYKTNKRTIDDVLKIPKELRIKWGIYKNLLNGVTTVVNHGEELKIDDDLITVFQNVYSLHSIHFEKNWKWKLNNPVIKDKPFVLHVGEGTNRQASSEIDALIRGNNFKRKLIGIHGVAMSEQQASSFKALVWCVASNYFLLGKTADVGILKSITAIIFGSDSNLSSSWNIWEHFRMARKQGGLSDAELLKSFTSLPAEVWGLKNCGDLKSGYDADIVIAKKISSNAMDNLYATDPQEILMVMHKGNIQMFDELIKDQMIAQGIGISYFSKVILNGAVKYVKGNLPKLVNDIKHFYADAFFPFSY